MTRGKPKTYCDDWSCPSLWGCERSWARAEEYWNFDQDDFDLGRVANRKFERRKAPTAPGDGRWWVVEVMPG